MVNNICKVQVNVKTTKHVVCEVAQAEVHNKTLQSKQLGQKLCQNDLYKCLPTKCVAGT